jgi:UDP-2,4-diacetamido-2,4,6-trideoxy-beta-L-altropyranose hydrolase
LAARRIDVPGEAGDVTTTCIALRIAFRVDASIEIGTGHVMRCLTLAAALRERGANCVFLCRPHEGNLLDFIAEQGFRALALPQLEATREDAQNDDPSHAAWLGANWAEDARDSLSALANHTGGAAVDWLVVDHYALDARWEKALRPACKRLMVIDDLADRPHDCDLLLDQSLGREAADYAGLLSPAATTLLGPRYALLRPEFALLRGKSLARRAEPKLERLLVTLGGVDKDNVTTRVLDALDASTLPETVRVTVVMGPRAPWLDAVRSRAARMRHPTEVLVGVRDMARLMAQSDLAIGAGGSTTWERCALGVPSILLVAAENQKDIAKYMHQSGAAVSVGDFRDAGCKDRIAFEVEQIVASVARLGKMSRDAAEISDGNGLERVATALLERTPVLDTDQKRSQP